MLLSPAIDWLLKALATPKYNKSLSQDCTSRIIRMNIFHGDYALLLSLNHFASIFGCGLLLEEDYIKYFTPGRLPRDDLDEISPDTYPEQVFWRSRNKTQCIKDRRLLYIPAIYDFRDVITHTSREDIS